MNDAVHGHCDSRFEKVADALAHEIANGEELGASIAVDIDGELVVDIWGGHADRAKTVAWGEDTIVNFFSCTKTLTALAALIAIDRGLVDAFAPVAKYWPEFAENGKQDIEVRHLLAHTSGVSGWEPPFEIEDIYDWAKATSHLARQAPWWQPGTASGYHAVNYGHLIGEVIRRATGKTLKEFVRDEIAEPLGADVQIGARDEDDPRIAELIPHRRLTSRWTRCPPIIRWSRRSRRSHPTRIARRSRRLRSGGAPTSGQPTVTATPVRSHARCHLFRLAAGQTALRC